MPHEITLPSPGLSTTTSPPARHVLVYFLPGNPSLIDYYGPFLTHLRKRLDALEATHPTTHYHICGRTFAGFDDADHSPPFDNSSHPPHDVAYQVTAVYTQLQTANTIPSPHARQGEPFDAIVLIGHSFGTYLTLELFHRHQQEPPQPPTRPLRLKTGILLFATVAHIVQSRRGVHINRLLTAPLVGNYIPRIAQAALYPLPRGMLQWFAATVLRMEPHAAAATARFLGGRDTVHQTLFLARDEMRVIADVEAWGEELWEVAEGEGGEGLLPKFFVFFGKDDEWVDNGVRTRFIEARREHAEREGVPPHKRGRVRCVIDEGDLPHDFCMRVSQSETVADRVAGWFEEMAAAQS